MSFVARVLQTTFLLIFLFVLTNTGAAQERALILQIHPYLSAEELIQRFSPLTQYLSQALNREVQIRIAKDYDTHITSFGQGSADLAYFGPAPYVTYQQRYGTPFLLARLEVNGKPFFRGALVTGHNSDITDLSELAGKTFAFGDAQSTMSHLVPRAMLVKAGVKGKDLKRFDFLHSHKNVALAVLLELYDAGAVKEEVYFAYKTRGLRLLSWSPPISEHLFIASPAMPATLAEKIRGLLMDLNNHSDQNQALIAIKKTVTGLAPVHDSDYDTLRDFLRIAREDMRPAGE